jgi:hypothetical protein
MDRFICETTMVMTAQDRQSGRNRECQFGTVACERRSPREAENGRTGKREGQSWARFQLKPHWAN